MDVTDAGMTLGEGGGVGVEIVSLQLRNGVSFLWNGLTTIVQGISRECIPCLCPCRQISVIICVGVPTDKISTRLEKWKEQEAHLLI